MACRTSLWPLCLAIVVLAVCLGLAAVHWQKQNDLIAFMEANALGQHGNTLLSAGVNYLEQFAVPNLLDHEAFRGLSHSERSKIKRVSEKLASSLLLLQWLSSRQLQHHHDPIQQWLDDNHPCEKRWSSKFGFGSVKTLAQLPRKEITKLSIHLKTTEFETYLLKEGIRELTLDDSWKRLILNPTFSSVQKVKEFFIFDRLLILTMPLGLLCFWVWGNYQLARVIPQQRGSERPASILNYITGSLLDVNCCKVDWGWTEPAVVGETMSFTIKFFQRNRRPYVITRESSLPVIVEITASQQRVVSSLDYGGTNEVKASFTVRRAGLYTITVRLGQMNIRGSPYRMNFLPGPVDPAKSGFVRHSSTMVMTRGQFCPLFIEPRDRFGNTCFTVSDTDRSDQDHCKDYCLRVTEIGSDSVDSIRPHYEVKPSQDGRQLALSVCMESTGCYKALTTYKKDKLSNGEFNILVLSETDAEKVKKNLDKRSTEGYEATLLSHNHSKQRRPKKVYCYISPKQLTVKEFYLRIIPKRLQTFRVCPATKFNFTGDQTDAEVPVFSIEDGCQAPMQLSSKHRDVMAATFTKFLLTNIGGSETFQDKQRCFYREVVSLRPRKSQSVATLNIDRHNLLESSMKACKPFSTSDWCKRFEITFLGEEGQDWGGLAREWTELVCTSLFSPENKFFMRFRDNNQGLVHPNPDRPSHLCKPKYYEFAGKIVGKCLYESSLGSATRQLVKARFSRSFLAQLIGLRVSHKYFETDDPDFYTTKVCFILDNDVDDMELTFSEEVYSKAGQLTQEVDLIPGGASLPVTNKNKIQYLDKLAHHRLANSVQDEIEAFLKGLNDMIPDQLLSMFDENELELLMCGTCAFSVTDMQRYYAPSGQGEQFAQMLDWFWTVVASFTQEEMARLLQFTTGCSQLPPGGFAELSPKFQIIAAPTHGTLPTAHTCFNQLCLPTYDSIEHLQKALVLAINEGGEGFGLL